MPEEPQPREGNETESGLGGRETQGLRGARTQRGVAQVGGRRSDGDSGRPGASVDDGPMTLRG